MPSGREANQSGLSKSRLDRRLAVGREQAIASSAWEFNSAWMKVTIEAKWLLIPAALAIGFFWGGSVHVDGLFGAIPAAWLQAFGSIAAIVGSVWLQQYSERSARKQLRQSRLSAAAAISNACRKTLTILDTRARQQSFTPDLMQFYADETAADLASIKTIPIAEIDDPRFIAQVVAMRRTMATAARRVGFIRKHLRDSTAYDKRAFVSLRSEADKVIAELNKL